MCTVLYVCLAVHPWSLSFALRFHFSPTPHISLTCHLPLSSFYHLCLFYPLSILSSSASRFLFSHVALQLQYLSVPVPKRVLHLPSEQKPQRSQLVTDHHRLFSSGLFCVCSVCFRPLEWMDGCCLLCLLLQNPKPTLQNVRLSVSVFPS